MNDAPIDLAALKPFAPASTEPACGNCRFALAQPKGPLICRRNPPSAGVLLVPMSMPVLVGGQVTQKQGIKPQSFTTWPEVEATMWCGAHEPAARSVETQFPPVIAAQPGAFGTA
jgi:hypothetical protein